MWLSLVILVSLVCWYEHRVSPKEKAEKAAYRACEDNAKALLDNAHMLRKPRCGKDSTAG